MSMGKIKCEANGILAKCQRLYTREKRTDAEHLVPVGTFHMFDVPQVYVPLGGDPASDKSPVGDECILLLGKVQQVYIMLGCYMYALYCESPLAKNH